MYRLSGAINPRGAAPSVCVPVFSRSSDNYTYVQHVGIDDNILLFELAELSEWEPVLGNSKAKAVEPGQPAVHWVAWSEDLHNSVVDTADVVRADIISKRWLVDAIDNPFERLDFAQLSGVYAWFSEEAERCEGALPDGSRRMWLEDTLLLTRARFAVDSVLLQRSTPASIRRKINLHLLPAEALSLQKRLEDLCRVHASEFINDDSINAISNFLSRDLAFNYANSRLFGQDFQRVHSGSVARWYKKITPSDAQRKGSGHQRGGITLVAAGFPVNTQTYFRQTFFGDADWVKGRTRTNKELETASIRMNTSVLNRNMGVLSFSVTYAPNRQSKQANYTTVLHLGPLADLFAQNSMEDKWLLLERKSDGSYNLSISDRKPE